MSIDMNFFFYIPKFMRWLFGFTLSIAFYLIMIIAIIYVLTGVLCFFLNHVIIIWKP